MSGRQKQNREKGKVIIPPERLLLLILFITLTLLLILGPFYRGLFFTRELLVAQVLIFGMLVLWGVYRLVKGSESERLFKTPLDLCLLLLLLAYFISFFVAVHKRDALEELLKIAAYLVIYLVAFELSINKIWPIRVKKGRLTEKESSLIPPGLAVILHLLFMAAVVVAIASLGAASGHWSIPGAYQDAAFRIGSPLGYANSAAAYLMSAFLLTIGLASLAGSWWKRSLYLVPATLIFITTILTFSRGAWLLLPPLALLMIIASAPGMKLRTALLMVATAIPAAMASFMADPLFRSANPAAGWGPVTAALLAAFIFGAFFELYLAQQYRIRLIAGIASLAVVLMAIILILALPWFSLAETNENVYMEQESPSVRQQLNHTLELILPERYYDRIFSAGRDQNLNARLEMFGDAVKIIKDYPLLGTGGGGWKALYQAYQARVYYSTEVHNHILQVWVEAGVLGFLAFLGIWLSLTLAFIRNCIKNKAPTPVRQKWLTVFMPLVALGAHSVIDWNFSLPAVGIYLFVLLGASKSLDMVDWFKAKDSARAENRKRMKAAGFLAIVIGSALLIYNILLFKGFNSTWRSQVLLEQGNLEPAVVELGQAIKYDPLRAENYYNLNLLFDDQARSSGERREILQLIYLARRAYELEPYNPAYTYRYGELMLNYVDRNEGMEIINRVIELRPLQANGYLQAGLIRLQLVELYIGSGNLEEAELYLTDLDLLEQKMFANLGDAGALAFIMGRAMFLRGDYDRSQSYFEQIPEDDAQYHTALEHLNAIKEAQ